MTEPVAAAAAASASVSAAAAAPAAPAPSVAAPSAAPAAAPSPPAAPAAAAASRPASTPATSSSDSPKSAAAADKFIPARAAITWTIDNFIVVSQGTKPLSSPVFHSIKSNNYVHNFYVLMYPEGCVAYAAGQLFFTIEQNNPTDAPLKIRVRLALETKDDLVRQSEFMAEFKPNTRKPIYSSFCSMNREDLLVFIKKEFKSDKIKINVKIEEFVDMPPPPPCRALEHHKMVERLGALHREGKFTDVSLFVGETELRAHKNILWVQSPVFAAMFDHDTKEHLESRVVIKDINVDAVREMICYMYTNKVKDMPSNALDLLAAANLYQIDGLKHQAMMYLCSTLKDEHVCENLLYADFYNAPELKTKCIAYITEHSDTVSLTPGWIKLCSNPELMSQLFKFQHSRYQTLKRKRSDSE